MHPYVFDEEAGIAVSRACPGTPGMYQVEGALATIQATQSAKAGDVLRLVVMTIDRDSAYFGPSERERFVAGCQGVHHPVMRIIVADSPLLRASTEVSGREASARSVVRACPAADLADALTIAERLRPGVRPRIEELLVELDLNIGAGAASRVQRVAGKLDAGPTSTQKISSR